jgi:hypothetical protein
MKKARYIYFAFLVLLIVWAIFFGKDFYISHQVDKKISSTDYKLICLASSYGVRVDPQTKKQAIDFGDGHKFYVDFKGTADDALYILLIVDKADKIMWTTIARRKADDVSKQLGLMPPKCHAARS